MINKYLDAAKEVELRFAKQHLKNFVFSTREQDIFEHWDVEGDIFGGRYKFDIKGLKRTSRDDKLPQNDSSWIEGTNVNGHAGWIKGKADYIAFERIGEWLVCDRKKLYYWTMTKLAENNFERGKGAYKIYQRQGRKDKITVVIYDDIPDDLKITLK